jgi:hypothetical protein
MPYLHSRYFSDVIASDVTLSIVCLLSTVQILFVARALHGEHAVVNRPRV